MEEERWPLSSIPHPPTHPMGPTPCPPADLAQGQGGRHCLLVKLGCKQVCGRAVAATPRLSWNLRVSPDDQALIDRAVRASGLTRTDFVSAGGPHRRP